MKRTTVRAAETNAIRPGTSRTAFTVCAWCRAPIADREPASRGDLEPSHGLCAPCARRLRRERGEATSR